MSSPRGSATRVWSREAQRGMSGVGIVDRADNPRGHCRRPVAFLDDYLRRSHPPLPLEPWTSDTGRPREARAERLGFYTFPIGTPTRTGRQALSDPCMILGRACTARNRRRPIFREGFRGPMTGPCPPGSDAPSTANSNKRARPPEYTTPTSLLRERDPGDRIARNAGTAALAALTASGKVCAFNRLQ